MSDTVETGRPLVVYHGGCPDGWCCAWLFHRHMGDGADYLAARYGDPPPDVAGRPHVYISDFSWPANDMCDLAKACGGRLTVIDHHRTAERALGDLAAMGSLGAFPVPPRVVFDQSHSGASLTWRHLKDLGATDGVFADGNPPLIVAYTEDRDLWSWRLPDSREVSAALHSYPREFGVWDGLHGLLAAAGGDGYWRLVREGAAVLRATDMEVERACGAAVDVVIAGCRVKAVNTTVHHSEVGGRLAEGRPFGATFYDDLKRGFRAWSLRSRDGGVDVSEVAKKFGGGGHLRAAGFQRPLDESLSALA